MPWTPDPKDTETVKGGTCPRCSTVVLYASQQGIQTMVEAVPLDAAAEPYVTAAGLATFSVWKNHLKQRTQTFRTWDGAAALTIHLEHTRCGNVKARAIRRQAVVKPFIPVEHDPPPFDWRPALCAECRVFFTDDEKRLGLFVGYYYSSSQWWAMHSEGCPRPAPRKGLHLQARKPVYAKVDKWGKVIVPKGKAGKV